MFYKCQEHPHEVLVIADSQEELKCPLCGETMQGPDGLESMTLEEMRMSFYEYEYLRTGKTSATPPPPETLKT